LGGLFLNAINSAIHFPTLDPRTSLAVTVLRQSSLAWQVEGIIKDRNCLVFCHRAAWWTLNPQKTTSTPTQTTQSR